MTKHKDSNSLSLSLAMAEAGRDNAQVVLFQVQGTQPFSDTEAGQLFHEEKIFKNEAHTLIVYTRTPQASP